MLCRAKDWMEATQSLAKGVLGLDAGYAGSRGLSRAAAARRPLAILCHPDAPAVAGSS